MTSKRIEKLFKESTHKILNVYCTAGYPEPDSTLKIVKALQDNGVDMVELGMPYSDPLADGPVIQESSAKALGNGMTIRLLLEQLKDMRKTIHLPVILMGYMNPVLQYGFENFCRDAAAAGVDGLILPDLPLHEFETEYNVPLRQYGLDFIFLVTPETSAQRIRKIDSLGSGFIYAVSSSSTTGSDQEMKSVDAYLERLQAMKLKNPVMVGFGIKDKKSFDTACHHANGAIIGTAFVKAMENSKDIESSVKNFVKTVR